MRVSFTVYKNAVRRWQTELSGHSTARVYSPFLSASTCKAILRHCPPQSVSVHTLFSLENFASGSSSIRALRWLFDNGYSIYHIEALHAKVVMVEGEVASVGSQNLTRTGATNKEVSIVTSRNETTEEIERLVTSWDEERVLVTEEMIKFAEGRLTSARRLFQKARAATTTLEVELWSLAETTRKQRVTRLRESLLAASVATEVKYGTVSWLWSSATRSLLAARGESYTHWLLNGGDRRLIRLERYAIFSVDTGRIGWARLAGTRITFVASGLQRSGLVEWHEGKHQLVLNASQSTDDGWNLAVEIRVHGHYGAKVVAHTWFSPDEFHVLRVDEEYTHPMHEATHGEATAAVARAAREDQSGFHTILKHAVFSPFRYKEALLGGKADQFFGDVGTSHWLRIQEIGDYVALVTGRGYWTRS